MKPEPHAPLRFPSGRSIAQLPFHGPPAAGDAPQAGTRDILGEHLFPPQLILQHADAIGLDEAHQEAIEAEVENVQVTLPGQQEDLQSEMEALGAQLGAGGDDESAIMAQLDKVLDKERDIKRLQIGMLLRVRSQLSAEQRQALHGIKQQLIVKQQELQKRIQEKVNRVQQGIRRYGAAGRQPPASLIQAMQNFQKLAKQNDVQGAEAALDEALLQLQLAP